MECCHAILFASFRRTKETEIGILRAAGRSIGAVAKALGRAKGTITRELRGRTPLGGYSPLHAAGAYQLRRRREATLERDRGLARFRPRPARRGLVARTDFRLA